MLLTGFDAPVEQVMYLDKPLRDHKLLQAIARTNRPYPPNKEAGIIVDYANIFGNLVRALNFEEKDIEGVAYDFDLLRSEFKTQMAKLLAIFEGIERTDSRDCLLAVVDRLEDPESLKEFKEGLSRLKALYETLAPDAAIFELMNDYAWLISQNLNFNRWLNRDKPDLSTYEAKTKQLIMEKLMVGQLDRILPIIEVNKDYLEKVDSQYKSEDDKIREMKRALQHHISLNARSNPAYETLGERLEKILQGHDKYAQLRELTELTRGIITLQKQREEMGITEEEFAVIGAIRKYADMDDATMKAFVQDMMKKVKGRTFPGWQRKIVAINEIGEIIYEACFAKFSKKLGLRATAQMSEEIERVIARYNSR